jgi:hypothetical protein
MDPPPDPLIAVPPYPCVGIYVVPTGGGDPTSTLIEELETLFAQRQVICVGCEILNPDYVGIDVDVDVVALSSYLNEEVQNRVVEAIVDFFDEVNTDFGMDVYLSDFMRMIDELEGVDHVDVAILAKATVGSGVGNVELTETEVPIIGSLTVDCTGGAY